MGISPYGMGCTNKLMEQILPSTGLTLPTTKNRLRGVISLLIPPSEVLALFPSAIKDNNMTSMKSSLTCKRDLKAHFLSVADRR